MVSREGRFNGFPLNGIFGDGIIFVAETYQGEGEIALQDARRGLARHCNLPPCS